MAEQKVENTQPEVVEKPEQVQEPVKPETSQPEVKEPADLGKIDLSKATPEQLAESILSKERRITEIVENIKQEVMEQSK